MKLSKELWAISVLSEYFRFIWMNNIIKGYIWKLFESHNPREVLSYWNKLYPNWYVENLWNISILNEWISIWWIIWDFWDVKIDNEWVTYFDYNWAVNAAKNLWKYLPTEKTFRYCISLMPWEDFKEKSFNFFLFIWIWPFGYIVNNSFEWVSSICYWSSTCDTQNFHKAFQLDLKRKKVWFESKSDTYNLPVRLVSKNYQ